MEDGKERGVPRGVSDSKTGGTLSKKKACLGRVEAERKRVTEIGCCSGRQFQEKLIMAEGGTVGSGSEKR